MLDTLKKQNVKSRFASGKNSILISVIIAFVILSGAKNLYAQNDGSNCIKAITLPSPVKDANFIDFKMTVSTMFFQFTSTSDSILIITAPSNILPVAQIRRIQLWKGTCPNLTLLWESSSTGSDMPTLIAGGLIVGNSYFITTQKDVESSSGNFKLSAQGDVGGGPPPGGGGSGGGTSTCSGATEAAGWVYDAAKSTINACDPNTKLSFPNFTMTADYFNFQKPIKIGNSIWLGGTQQGSGQNELYTDNGDLLIQSNATYAAYKYNTILNANGGNVGIKTAAPHFDNSVEVVNTIGLWSGNSSYPVKAQMEQNGLEFYIGENIFFSGGIWQKFDASFGTSQIRLLKNGQILFLTGKSTEASPGNEKMRIDENGNVIVPYRLGVGKSPDALYSIDVCGPIRSKEWIVENITGCDFVFEENYKRSTFQEKEKWFKEKKHLRGLATAKEMETKGMSAAQTISGIILNVEENSLDIIDLYKKVTKIEEENKELKTILSAVRKENEEMKKEIETFKKR